MPLYRHADMPDALHRYLDRARPAQNPGRRGQRWSKNERRFAFTDWALI